MAAFRSLRIVLLAFSISLAALGLAALVAWRRCADGDCSLELALGITALAPSALLLAVMLLLLAAKSRNFLGARILLAVTVGVAVVPIAAFIVRDVWSLIATGVLFAVAVLLVLFGEQGPDSERSVAREQEAQPARRPVEERQATATPPRIGRYLAPRVGRPQHEADRLAQRILALDEAERRLRARIEQIREQRRPSHDERG